MENFLVDGNQAKPDLLDLEDISPGRKLRSIGKFFQVSYTTILSRL